MSDELPDPPLPPLTREEFDDGCGYTFRGVPMVEHEDGTYIYAYGHVDPEQMVKAIAAYDWEVAGGEYEGYAVEDVKHVHGLTLKPPSDPDGWFIAWPDDATAETPGSFPMTVVTR
jgi:hypothetical protein